MSLIYWSSFFFFFSSRRRHTRWTGDWSSDVCSSDLGKVLGGYTAQATVNTILIELLRKRGVKPDEYKILNVGTARLPALLSGNVPAAVLNGLETAKAVKQGFRP